MGERDSKNISAPRRRKVLFGVTTVVVLVFLFLAGTELVLRLRLAREIRGDEYWSDMVRMHIASPDPGLLYRLNPGASVPREGILYTNNADGFRDDEFPREPPEGTRRIVLIGDSVTWGYGTEHDRVFGQVLERRLGEATAEGEPAPVVYNLGVGGYSTSQEIRQLELHGLPLEPDIVFLIYVMNDPDVLDGGLGAYFTRRRLELIRLTENAIFNLADQPTNEDLANEDRVEYHQFVHRRYRSEIDENFTRLGEISRENELPIVVVVSPVFLYEPGGEYRWANLHAEIEERCAANGLRFIDLFDTFASHDPKDVAFDLWHPNDQGHAIIAKVLSDYLTEHRDRP